MKTYLIWSTTESAFGIGTLYEFDSESGELAKAVDEAARILYRGVGEAMNFKLIASEDGGATWHRFFGAVCMVPTIQIYDKSMATEDPRQKPRKLQ